MHLVDVRTVALAAMIATIGGAFVCVAPLGTPPYTARIGRAGSAQGVRSSRAIYRQERGRQQQGGVQLSAEETKSEMPGFPGFPNLPGIKTIVETEEEAEERAVREWADDGRRGRVLIRRREIPMPELSPAEACRIVFQSLQNNDDPLLDYGAAVAIKFASSHNAVSRMTPLDYGTFLRNDPEYSLLVENSSCRPTAKAKPSPDGTQMLQTIELVGTYPDVSKRLVEVQLSKEDDCWKIDAITFVP